MHKSFDSQVCVLAVPKHVPLLAGDDKAAHLRAVGYRIASDDGEPVQLEGTDDFVTRMQACLVVIYEFVTRHHLIIRTQLLHRS